MAQDNVFVGDAAREALMCGVNKVADAVKGTLGAGGYNALLADPRPPFSVATNDGISVARAIELVDPIEQMGANLMREIGAKSDRDGGDGTTTSITLAQAILKEGLASTASPMEIKRSLDACLPLILKSIDDQTKQITVNEVGKVATISAEDEKLGALIQEVYQHIGKDGILYTDVSKGNNDYYTIGKGVKYEDAGLISPYMSDVDDKGNFTKTVNLATPQILVSKQKLKAPGELEQLVNALAVQGIKDLVLFCDEVENTVIADLIQVRVKSRFRVIVIKMPVLWKDQWIEDIAKMTGATVVDPSLGLSLKDAHVNYLGTCANITIDKYDTYFDGIASLDAYISSLNDEGNDDAKVRAARLSTKTARLFVGAHSDSALSYKRLKLEDARNAAYQALQGGVVAGGGVTLLNAAQSMPATEGGIILAKALQAPYWQISENAGIIGSNQFNTKPGGTMGLDAQTGTMGDMFEMGIVDPAKIVKNAVINALSVASIVLTTKVIVTPPEPVNVGSPERALP